ncbi:glycosyltransferase family 2 protein [Candidatus Hydrogenosomobacter endosymbioticus]|uniref:Glycosyl transferase n=1 Tax=Candidatus Hydrogenosomobacter endosymbioticus TaxID=2558174 RepID=A0ABM7V9W2_9PROT|nr:glycosyltransferase family 2 protein [Candidatus Hydrogenosomobacter endosymbioticus]BDB96583.1 glycosyl transferase [Candidatus Hydrogenosomobacter endosymbioticus]
MNDVGSRKRLISVVTSAFNEDTCIDALADALKKVFHKEPAYDFEVVIVDNGSSDMTYDKAAEIHKNDPRFKVLRLTRNFYIDGGISAGYAHCSGDAAIYIAADLQEPVELIHDFLRKWEEGYVNVYGVIRERKDFSKLRYFNSKLFYEVLYRFTGGSFIKNVADFRLMDRELYKTLNKMEERNRILRGLVSWMGGKSIGIPYDRKDRVAGKTKADTRSVVIFALKALFNFSYVPLVFTTVIGCALSGLSFFMLFVWSIKFMFWGVPFKGYGTIMGVMLLLFGFVFIMLGIMGKYISMIFDEVKARPNFIVQDKLGF